MKAFVEKILSPTHSSFIYKRRNDRAFDFTWHFHPEYELTLIVQSRGKRFVGDHISDYAGGDLIFLGPNLPHTWYSEPTPSQERHQAVVIQFSESFLGESFFQKPEMTHLAKLLKRSAMGIRFFGEVQRTVAERMLEMDKRQGFARLTELLSILDTLARSKECQYLSSKEYIPSLRSQDFQRIDRVCRFINQSFRDSITQPEAASVAHMSVPAFSRFFKKSTGKTFMEYLSELRIGHACRLLIESDKNVAEICYESGFNNLSNFNRRFLELKKINPRQFRREFASKNTSDLR